MRRLAAALLLVLPLGCYTPGPVGDEAGCPCCEAGAGTCKGCGKAIKTGTTCADCEKCAKATKP